MLVFIFLIICITPVIIFFYRRWINIVYLSSKFQRPFIYPIIGHLPYFSQNATEIFKVSNNIIKIYGKNVLMVGFLYEIGLFTADPKVVKLIVGSSNIKKTKKSWQYDLMHDWIGTGLLSSYGNKWLKRRKLITPCFHFTILEQFLRVFNKQSDIYVDKIKCYKGDYNICKDISLLTLDVICEAAMGVSISAQLYPNLEYARAVEEMATLIHRRTFSTIGYIPFLYNLSEAGRNWKKTLKTLHDFTISVIEQRHSNIIKNQDTLHTNSKNFLDMLLMANVDGKQLTDDDIREEVDTFMFEGHDTTSSGICFALYLLSNHEEIQDKVLKEIHEVCGTDVNQNLSYRNLCDLKYLELVIKETLRLYPSVPFIGRELQQEIVIDGAIIPAGTQIIFALYAMFRNADYFPEPEKFYPERFLSDNNNFEAVFSYIPFSAGPRNCIGQKFAMLEMKCLISKVLLRYKLLPAKEKREIQLQGDLILKSSNGVYLQLQRRDN